MTQTTYLSPAETARYVRKALRREFPGVKFSVRSKSYSGGGSIDVRWTDGPTLAAVKNVAGAYSGSTFDAMVDLKTSHVSELSYEDDPALDGLAVHFGADFVFCERGYSEAFAGAIRERLVARYPDFDWPPVRDAVDGYGLDWQHPSYYESPCNGGLWHDCGHLFTRLAEEDEA